MKARKVVGLLAGLMILVAQISYSDPAVDRLLKEARKRQATQKKEEAVQEVEVETEKTIRAVPTTPVTTTTGGEDNLGAGTSIRERAEEIKREQNAAQSGQQRTGIRRANAGNSKAQKRTEARANKARMKNMTESEKMNVEVQRIKKRVDEINRNIETFHKTNEALEKMEERLEGIQSKMK